MNVIFQDQVIEFLWSSITHYDIDDHCGMFCFQYKRQNKPPRWVKIYSNHVRNYALVKVKINTYTLGFRYPF